MAAKYRFGEKLREVRERKQMTMKEVAEAAGVTESLISQIERNKVSPAIDTLLSITEILDID
ncbi:MAG: helix-turn-helix domain-containing protein, partial [Spirochaetota bacterium]